MKYDKVTILGVAGCVLAFALLIKFAPTPVRPATPTPAALEQQQLPPVGDGPAAVPAVAGTTADGQPVAADGATVPAAVSATVPTAVSAAPGALPLWPEPSSTQLESHRPGECIARIDRAGGGITSVLLEHYFLDKPRRGDAPPAPVVLGNYDTPFLALDLSAAGIDFDGIKAEGTDNVVQLSRSSRDGRLVVNETWAPDPENQYQYTYSIRILNLSTEAIVLNGLAIEGGALPPSVSPNRKAGRGESAGGATVSVQGEKHARTYGMKDLVKMSAADRLQLTQLPVAWTAVHSKYFLFHVWQSGSLFAGADVATAPAVHQEGVSTDPSGRYRVRLRLPALQLPPGGEQDVQVHAYAGPKNFKQLHALGNGVDTIMEMDRFFFFRPAWMGFLSRMLLEGMVWISGLFPPSVGYGMGVICLTLLVKLLFWPLTHKSTVSMRKMQALQPQLKELREKYKDDAQKMYRKQQELFKENKVSQLGGCLPMLMQIPVFFALFNTFRNAVELRQAGFLWAADLSLPDTLAFSPDFLPIRPFALLMGMTMYWQQKMTPSADPNQAKMMNMMSLFFIVLFYGMPSALTLYMAVNYILTIGQTLLTRKMDKNSPAPAPKTLPA